MTNFSTKIVAVGMAAALVACAMTACKTTNETTAESTEMIIDSEPDLGDLVGGWQIPEDMAVTEEAKSAFESVASELGQYQAIKLLATQVVAGTNYCILAQSTAMGQMGPDNYRIAYVNVDPSGKASLLRNDEILLGGVRVEDLEGGWSKTVQYDMDGEQKAAFDKGTEALAGATYEVVACVGEQAVAGTNYAFLCKATASVPNGSSYFVLVYVYADLQGNSEITETIEIELNATSESGVIG